MTAKTADDKPMIPIGQHEVVHSQTEYGTPEGTCRKCAASFKGPDYLQKFLLNDCVPPAPSVTQRTIDLGAEYTPRPRGDIVLVRVEVRDEIGGLKLPQNSPEGREYYVEAVGDKVDGLKAGDRVLMKGKAGVDYAYVPGFQGLIVIAEHNILLVMEPKDKQVEKSPGCPDACCPKVST